MSPVYTVTYVTGLDYPSPLPQGERGLFRLGRATNIRFLANFGVVGEYKGRYKNANEGLSLSVRSYKMLDMGVR